MTEETTEVPVIPKNIHAQELARRKKGRKLNLSDKERRRRKKALASVRSMRWKKQTKTICSQLNEDAKVI